MRGGILPPALLFAALGLALAFAPQRAWVPSLLALTAMIGSFIFVPLSRHWLETVYFGFWLTVIATAASVHLYQGLNRWSAVALSLNAGFWASALASVSGARLDLLIALPSVSMLFIASWLVGRQASVAVKVVSSWIIAIAVLSATLQLLPVTPGYLPDHLE